MNPVKTLITLFAAIVFCSVLGAQDYHDVRINVQKLSDRVIVLTEDSPMENNLIALATEKGIVVVDTGSSYITGAAMRKRIADELGRDDFVYTIDTHYHWDHARGNQVFADTTIIGHVNTLASMRADVAGIPGRLERRSAFLEGEKQRLAGMDPESEEARELKWRLEYSLRNFACDSEGFELTLPHITFKDRMTLDMGDMTLNLVFFGRAHSGSDILIHVPEEGILLTGDLFLDRGWMPLFAGQRKLDVPRFIEALGSVLDADDSVKTVVPGHRELWSRKKLVLWRDYIVSLWDTVNAVAADGLEVDAVAARYPLEKPYFYMLDLGHTEEEIREFHNENIHDFWRQTLESATDLVETALEEGGLDAARGLFKSLLEKRGKGILFDEADFNTLGYALMQRGNLDAAICIFELNVDAFPQSWNVYDSLGEALLNHGQKERAVENYKRSIELNPGNENGKALLRSLGVQQPG